MRITLYWLFFSWCSFASAEDWGELPDGFTWHENSEAKVAIPLPKGWYVKEEVRNGTVAVFLSEEDIGKQGKFYTGYSLNYVKNISNKTGMDVTEYAAGYILEAQKHYEVLLDPWADELGAGLVGMGIRFLLKEGNSTAVVQHYLIVDKEEDTLRIMIFESPEEKWESAWTIGETMLSKGKLWK